MLVSVTLNPCIDQLLELDAFASGGLNRVQNSRIDVAGKGLNVSVAYKHLGGETLCTGFCHTDGGERIAGFLSHEGIPYDFAVVDGCLRTNIKVLDRATGQTTEINAPGCPAGEASVAALIKKVRELAAGADTVVISGSVPPDVPADIYRSLVTIAKEAGARCVLDAQGPLLLSGIEAHPDLIKPNLYELESTFGVRIADTRDIVSVARSIVGKGVMAVAVTLGSAGAAIVGDDEAWYAPAIPVPVRGLCGAGDSAVAGFCRAMDAGLPLREVLRYGIAAATASVILPGTALVTLSDFESYLSRVAVEPL